MQSLKVLALISLAFGAGYVIGHSDNDELKGIIDNIIDKVKNSSQDAKAYINKILETSEEMTSDELKANYEKLLSLAMEQMEKIK